MSEELVVEQCSPTMAGLKQETYSAAQRRIPARCGRVSAD